MKKTELKKSRFKRILLIGIPLLLIIVLLFPLNHYIEMPGSTEPVNKMVKIENKKDNQKGNFYLTTVEVMRANLATLIWEHFNPFATVYSSEELMGDMNSQQYDLVNQYYMQTAQNMAIYQAFKLAKQPYKLKYAGVYVMEITKDSSFKKDLQVSDTITKVNGQSFQSSQEMIDYVSKQKVGDSVTINYNRVDGTSHQSTGKYIKLSNGKTGIGISLVDHTEVESTPKVTINAGSIGGPSAGMMFTLEIYSQISNKDLRQGRQIAGTGTIEYDGSIGQIGGIDKKIATASKEGAEIFLAPDNGEKTDNNYLDAKKAAEKLKTKMKIIPVKTLQDAVNYLETGKTTK